MVSYALVRRSLLMDLLTSLPGTWIQKNLHADGKGKCCILSGGGHSSRKLMKMQKRWLPPAAGTLKLNVDGAFFFLIPAMLRDSEELVSDNQQLVSFINVTNQSSPPEWRIKNLTQQFMNYNRDNNFKIFKIRRQGNQTAHLLAKQAFTANHPQLSPIHITCTNMMHV